MRRRGAVGAGDGALCRALYHPPGRVCPGRGTRWAARMCDQQAIPRRGHRCQPVTAACAVPGPARASASASHRGSALRCLSVCSAKPRGCGSICVGGLRALGPGSGAGAWAREGARRQRCAGGLRSAFNCSWHSSRFWHCDERRTKRAHRLAPAFPGACARICALSSHYVLRVRPRHAPGQQGASLARDSCLSPATVAYPRRKCLLGRTSFGKSPGTRTRRYRAPRQRRPVCPVRRVHQRPAPCYHRAIESATPTAWTTEIPFHQGMRGSRRAQRTVQPCSGRTGSSGAPTRKLNTVRAAQRRRRSRCAAAAAARGRPRNAASAHSRADGGEPGDASTSTFVRGSPAVRALLLWAARAPHAVAPRRVLARRAPRRVSARRRNGGAATKQGSRQAPKARARPRTPGKAHRAVASHASGAEPETEEARPRPRARRSLRHRRGLLSMSPIGPVHNEGRVRGCAGVPGATCTVLTASLRRR